MPSLNEITVVQLNRLIGTPDCPAIVDISIDPDFAEDPFLIPGSFRHPHTDIPGLIDRLYGQPCVVTCQRGIKLSQGLVAWLRSEGHDAEYLTGGMYGWRDATDTLRIPAGAIPEPVGGSTLWVTRHRPKIDRIACPWLIRRFVDPNARFLFVSPAEVEGVASRYGATAFDVDGAFWSHRNQGCTFDTMLAEFALQSPALMRLADVVRSSDLGQPEQSPQAAGLLAIYDALYRWAGDGFEETHASAIG